MKALSSLHPWPRPAGPLQLDGEPEFVGSSPRLPHAGEDTANPDPLQPQVSPDPPRGLRTHRPILVPPLARPPGPRTSRKVSVFISLQGVSTIRAASRTPSVALAKHWGKSAGCGWGPGPRCEGTALPHSSPWARGRQRHTLPGRVGVQGC